MIGVTSLIPLAASENPAAECLFDGDYGISPLGGLKGRSFEGEAKFRWNSPVSMRALMIYPAPGASGKCSISLGDGRALEFDLSDVEKTPGAYFRFHFEQATVSELSIRSEGAICEVIALGA
jgi:hypothetical protein